MKAHTYFHLKESVFKLAGTMLLTTALVACGGGGDDPAPKNDNTGGNGTGSGGGSKTELEGSWKLCQSMFGEYSDSTKYTFSGSGFSEESERYTDLNCSDKEKTLTSYTGTFEIKNSMTTGGGNTAKEIDFQYLTGFAVNQQPKFYDIFLIDNDALYLGDVLTGNKTSTDQRPTDVSYNLPYINESGNASGSGNTVNRVNYTNVAGYKITANDPGASGLTLQSFMLNCDNTSSFTATHTQFGTETTNGTWSSDEDGINHSEYISLGESWEFYIIGLVNGDVVVNQSYFEGALTVTSIEKVKDCN